MRGVRPTFWRHYDYGITFEKRLDELAGWLALPASARPALIAFYLEETNSAGHRFGPSIRRRSSKAVLVPGAPLPPASAAPP